MLVFDYFITIVINIYFVSDGELYSGTVADFSGMEPIIYREPLQTEQYDSMTLNGKNYHIFNFIFLVI